jgi:FKBP-type peptidyl-prolyl cis-trans isomerase
MPATCVPCPQPLIEVLQLMPVGSKRQVFIPPDLACGGRGAGAGIGPDATLIFEVDPIAVR